MGTKIGTSQNVQSSKPTLKLEKKLVIKEGMSVDYVKQYGNAAQKMAATIFDCNKPGNWGDGVYSQREADAFNRCIFKLEKDKLTIYDPNMQKNGNRGITEMPISSFDNKPLGHYRDDNIAVGGEAGWTEVRQPLFFDKISNSADNSTKLVKNIKAKGVVTSSGKTTIVNGKIQEITAIHGGEHELINKTNKYNGVVKAYVMADNFATEKENIQSVKYDKNSKVKIVKNY